MKLTILATFTALAATITPTFAIPPEDFGFPSAPNDTILSVSFSVNNTYQAVEPGILFGITIPTNQPNLALQKSDYQSLSNYNGSFVLMMVDPDAKYPEAPNLRFILHWLQPNASYSTTSSSSPSSLSLPADSQILTNTSNPIVPYLHPSPPTNSSAHRYILYAFEQPTNFTIPAAYSGYSNANRTNFNLTNFIRDAKLGTPAAANYYYCSNETAVSPYFVGQPGAAYPGGNGMAVTSGDPGATAITATSTSAMMSMSSGASATGGSASSSSSHAVAATVGGPMAVMTGVSGIVGAGLLGLAAFL